jgi:hypothetical protein
MKLKRANSLGLIIIMIGTAQLPQWARAADDDLHSALTQQFCQAVSRVAHGEPAFPADELTDAAPGAPAAQQFSSAAAEQPQIPFADQLPQAAIRVAHGEAPFPDVLMPDPNSPAAYGNDIRNFYRDSDPNHWRMMVSVPGWFPEIKGHTMSGGKMSKVNLGFNDFYELLSHNLSAGAMLNVEARRGRWSVFTDILYLKLSGHLTKNATLPPLTVGGPGIDLKASGNFDASIGIYELGGAYRFLDKPWGGEESRKKISMDVIGGLRYWRIWSKLDANLAASVGPFSASRPMQAEAVKDWVDPFIGLRLQTDLTEKIFFSARGDIGGFGIGSNFSSEFTWKAQAGFSYNPTPRFSVFAGYQMLDVNYKDKGFGADLRLAGPVLAVGYTFGRHPNATAETSLITRTIK